MKKHTSRILKNVISSILVVLILFCFFVSLINITFNLLYTKTQVRGFSMQPTINMNMTDPNAEGDTIYINQFSSFTNDDIVVAKVSWYDKYIIKRVVGIPGDKVEIKDLGENFGVFVNDELLYTKDKYGDNTSIPKTGSYGYFEDYKSFLNNPEFKDYVVHENGSAYIQLKENEYFLMGDNWGHTTDSISKGPVKTNEIIGKVDCIVDITNDNPFAEFIFFMKKLFS